MLILVGVTINVALKGDLFEQAQTATIQTEKQLIYEQIIMGIKLNDGKINVEDTYKVAENTFNNKIKIIKESESFDIAYKVIEVQGKQGKHIYTITEEEILIGEYIPNSILGTYYIADMTYSIKLNEDETITEEGVLGENPTYTLNGEKEVIVTLGENAQIKDLINVETLTFEFNVLQNNKILLDKTNGILLAMNRNGLEGYDFEGTWDYYEGKKGDELDHLQIISNSCKFFEYRGSIDNTKSARDYFYYNNTFYTWYITTRDGGTTVLTTELAFYDSSSDSVKTNFGDCLTYMRSSS